MARLASPLLLGECAVRAPQNRPAQRLPMVNSSLNETLRGTTATNRLQIATLIETLLRSVELLTVEIEYEEVRVGVRDLSDPTYSVLARRLRARKDNIRATIVSLEMLDQEAPKAA